MPKPKFVDDEAFRSLRATNHDGFRAAIEGRRSLDLTGADLRGVDFRDLDLTPIVLRDAYLRDADLRGQDLRDHDLAGCSLLHAKISGTYFPAGLDAAEISMSLVHGTRLRVRG